MACAVVQKMAGRAVMEVIEERRNPPLHGNSWQTNRHARWAHQIGGASENHREVAELTDRIELYQR